MCSSGIFLALKFLVKLSIRSNFNKTRAKRGGIAQRDARGQRGRGRIGGHGVGVARFGGSEAAVTDAGTVPRAPPAWWRPPETLDSFQTLAQNVKEPFRSISAVSVDSANSRASVWGRGCLACRCTQEKFGAELRVTCSSRFSAHKGAFDRGFCWVAEAAFFLQRLCYAGAGEFVAKNWDPRPWDPLPVIAHAKSARSSLHEREGFCPK